MKHNISYLLFGLLACVFTACSTDDLKKDIDVLTGRVESMEAQVLSLNDNMNIIRVMLDGNKTITTWTENNGTYTLTLSNGETYTLTPGTVGGNFPPISISETGNWVINGVDTGKRALATDGTDATVTPQFKIESEAWWVSYDGGTTWSQLVNGNPTGTNTDVNPISAAAPDAEGNNFVITMNGTDYEIPIVQNLVCAIGKDALAESMEEGVWMVSPEAEATFQVTVGDNSDVLRVVAPVEWKTQKGIAENGVMPVTVTAPAGSAECVLTVEVTRGAHTVTDQIKIKTVSDSYYADYQGGFDVTIGDVTINKFDVPGAQLLEDGAEITAAGCYFVKDGATVALNFTNGVTLISEKKSGFNSKVKTVPANFSIAGTFLCKGVHLFAENITRDYWVNLSGTAQIDKVYFDRCKIELPNDKSFSYFSSGVGVDKFLITSCHIPSFPMAAKVKNFLNLNTKAFGIVEIKNNVFYCSESGRYSSITLLSMGKGSVNTIAIENNTFINFANWGNRLVNMTAGADWTVKKNLFWYDVEGSGSVNALANTIDASVLNEDNYSGNQVCTSLASPSLGWRLFYNNPTGFKNNELPVASGTTPFAEGFVPAEGIYTLTPEYAALGAGAIIK